MRGFPSSFENATVVGYGYDTEVLTQDLERDYWRIEDSGIPAIVKLRNDLPDDVGLNALLAMNSRRWIVGVKGTLNFNKAAVIAARRSKG
ncbi:hypothetical protein [Arthrobacter sp. CJ23]|uniref:hypothetical protein n=1 Tax=Arthrobacter sp. CJ23 TaxID=2972479 RepID=UPI00215B8F8B|nr:hypothetical protein [Arthrobacter sp. CJ23]UVJ39692.1 hypothetical protein NVV90_00355 [Arthrobacter sp. CJ23]